MKTVIVMDMLNGFCKKGALADPKIMSIVPRIRELCDEADNVIFVCDLHKDGDREFEIFPQHCLRGSWESEIIDELQDIEKYIAYKDNTNGMWNKGFWNCPMVGPNADVVITGCCTDICVLSFAIALKTFKNHSNFGGEVIIPADAVATYDTPDHNARYYNDIALDLMSLQGIKIE